MRCIAMREGYVNGSVVYTRCGLKGKGGKGCRFCQMHKRFYREIIVGILMERERREAVHK
jgi:hypothetical protein